MRLKYILTSFKKPGQQQPIIISSSSVQKMCNFSDDVIQATMQLMCNFSNDSHCSDLFEDVHVSVTTIKAILSLTIILLCIPTNTLLIIAMVKYRDMIDNSVFLAISFLVANIIVSLILGGTTVVTAMGRGWLFGFWGCQVSAFISTFGVFARLFTVGLLSCDRFCRIFLPFMYPRHEKNVIIIFLASSWAMALFAAVVLALTNTFTFVASIPSCFFVVNTSQMNKIQIFVAKIFLWISHIVGTIFPFSLYVAMWCKARRMKKTDPKPAINLDTPRTPQAPQTLEARIRAHKLTLTYFLTTLAFLGANVLIIIKYVSESFFLEYCTPLSIAIPVLFIFSFLIESYVITDVIIILTDRQQRGAFKKLLQNIYKSFAPRKI